MPQIMTNSIIFDLADFPATILDIVQFYYEYNPTMFGGQSFIQSEVGDQSFWSLFCTWFQCEMGQQPPFIYTKSSLDDPLVMTRLGPVQGYKMSARDRQIQIYAFTGVPYGEPTSGPNRFRDPLPRRPWKGTLKAKSPSPFCIQSSAATLGMVRGSEDCLYLDIYTPKIPENSSSPSPLFPVVMWIPAGANTYGRSRSYGPMYMLTEDIVFVPINFRVGIHGFLSTGDEASPGNWGLKDQALAVSWVHENIRAFGGDPNRIIIGGVSSGAYAAHLMLFTNHISRNYITGIVSVSGTSLANHGLDAVGRVKEASKLVAKEAGCPTSDSFKMVECMRSLDPYILQTKQGVVFKELPPMSKMLRPTLEPNTISSAFISELPEVQYAQRKVPPIPLIMTRTEDESSFILAPTRLISPLFKLLWFKNAPKILQLGLRTVARKGTPEESRQSLLKINQFYFNKTTPPNLLNNKEFVRFINMIDDNAYNAPTWKSIELHHKVAPTYTYICKLNTFRVVNRLVPLTQPLYKGLGLGAPHAADFPLLINNSKIMPPFPPGSDFDIASRNLVNMIGNFAAYGTPLYRNKAGDLLNLWKPVEDMDNPVALEVGLVHDIKMIRDPVAGTERLKIWEQTIF